MREITIDGRRFELDEHAVTRALERVLPEPVYEHYVVIEGRRFPPKQVIALVTGLDRAAFTTHHARRILSRLGFAAARRSQGGGPETSGAGDFSAGTSRWTAGRCAAPLHRAVGGHPGRRGTGGR